MFGAPRGTQIPSPEGTKLHGGRHKMLLTRVVGLLNQRKLVRGQIRNSGKTLLGPLLQQWEAKTDNKVLVHSHPSGFNLHFPDNE